MDKKLKKEFPGLDFKSGMKRMIYLDSACTAVKLQTAVDAQNDFLLSRGFCPGNRSVSLTSAAAEENIAQARSVIASNIGASPEEVVFSFSATDAANLLINSYRFSPGRNEVIISGLEHNCVLLPLHNMAVRGKIKLRIIPLKGFNPDFEAFKKMISRRTALVFVTRASNIFGGTVKDLEKFIALARKNASDFAVDESQFLPTHKEDLSSLGADFAFFSGHKLGAPFGTGILYVKKSAYKNLDNARGGGGIVSGISLKKSALKVDYLRNNRGFEPGIQNYSGILGLAAAMKFWEVYDYGKLRSHVSDLVNYALEKLKRTDAVEIKGDNLQDGNIVSFTVKAKSFEHQDFSIFLNEKYRKKFIVVRTGRHCADLACLFSGTSYTVRLSFHVYNTREDVDEFVYALKDYLDFLK